MKRTLMICLCLCLTGCMHFSHGYSPSEKTKTYNVAETQKVPLTFSVELDKAGPCGWAASNEDQLAEKIKKSLQDTGIFSTVERSAKGMGPGYYHISFTIRRACDDTYSEGLDGPGQFLFYYSIGLIPLSEENYLDGAAVVYLRDEEIVSFGKAEEITCFYWLPCIVVWPFANGPSVWNKADDAIINGLVNDFAEYHMAHFNKRSQRK